MVPTHAATTPTGLSIAPVSVITPQLQALSTFIQRRAQDVKVSGGRRKCTHKKYATQSHMHFFFFCARGRGCYATHQVTVQCWTGRFFFFFFPPFFKCWCDSATWCYAAASPGQSLFFWGGGWGLDDRWFRRWNNAEKLINQAKISLAHCCFFPPRAPTKILPRRRGMCHQDGQQHSQTCKSHLPPPCQADNRCENTALCWRGVRQTQDWFIFAQWGENTGPTN